MDSDIKVEKEAEVAHSCETAFMEEIRVLESKCSGPLKMVNGGDLGPVTPVPDRGIGEAFVGSNTPLACVFSPEVSNGSEVIQTPENNVFNPFAPGSEELALAPRKRSLEEELIYRPVRRLKFDSDCKLNVSDDDSEDVSLEKYFLQSIYESLLDVVVRKQAEGILDENLPLELDISDGFKTPTSSPFRTGIAKTCPVAPRKPVVRSTHVIMNPGVRRKLEF